VGAIFAFVRVVIRVNSRVHDYHENFMKKVKKQTGFDQEKIYSIEEALKLVKENAKAKFDESLEAHIRTGIDLAKGEQTVRANVVLPHGSGKTKKIAVFTENEKEALDAGADIVGGKELIEKIKNTGVIDFEVAVATPNMMKDLAQIAKVLGPKGLMPSPKNETVTANIKKAVAELKGGKITFKNDDTGNIHQLLGKISWDENKLKENFETFMEAVKRHKPAGIKGVFVKQVVICSSMGPAVKVII
jgi:large subunit ribosomal protein L1